MVNFRRAVSELEKMLDQFTTTVNLAMKVAKGVDTDMAAILIVAAGGNPERFTNGTAFAALCDVSPV